MFVLFLVRALFGFWFALFLVCALFGSCSFWFMPFMFVLFLVCSFFCSCSFWFLVCALFGSCPFWFVPFLACTVFGLCPIWLVNQKQQQVGPELGMKPRCSVYCHTFEKKILTCSNWHLSKHVFERQVRRYLMCLVIIVYSKLLKQTILN